MKNGASVEATWMTGQRALFSREAVDRVLDKSPDGYKLLARLVDDPYELLREYEPGSEGSVSCAVSGPRRGRRRGDKLQEQLRQWLIAGLRQEMAASIG